MLWPTPVDYVQAVGGYPDVCLLDPKLRGGKPKRTPTNQLLVYTGGFSTVFPIEVAHNNHALRCWNRDIGDSKNRYEKTDDYLTQVRLPYFVDFKYVPEGILINGKKWPITRMEWANGESLRDFIKHNLSDSNIFSVVANEFRKMFETLHVNKISHGDLQNGNILLTRNGANVKIKLIDYDSLFVPALRGESSPTPGLPEYQHPLRSDKCDEKMDYFSELVIYLSFLSLSEKPELWNQFKDKTEKGLLFSKDDIENPDQSDIFKELENLSSDVQNLASTLKQFCAKTSIDDLEPLEAILPKHDAKFYTDQGQNHINKSRYNDAISEFQKAIVLNPNYEIALYGLGLSYLHCNRYNEAINACEQAIYIEPNYKEAYLVLGFAYLKSGHNSKATIAANEALKIDPGYQPAIQLLNTIKTTTFVQSNSTNLGAKPSPDTKPSFDTKPSLDAKPNIALNVSKSLSIIFGIALVICIIALVAQVNEKNAAILETQKLRQQQNGEGTKIQRLTSLVQTLEKEKKTMSSDKQSLNHQLTKKNTEIQRLNTKIRVLENATNRNLISEQPSPSLFLNIPSGMVLIPAGEFRMGSNANDVNAYSDEMPEHTVYVDAFYIDKYEVTNEEYKKFIDANPQWRKGLILRKYHDGTYLQHWTGNNYPNGKANHPVIYVSWYAAMAYAKWKEERLPTEAEWEKAARGRSGYLENLIKSKTANYDWMVGGTTRVGNYFANTYGLYDILGNASEWCLDAYSSDFYAKSPRRNPIAGGSIYSIVREFRNVNTGRVARGGSWLSTANTVRITHRITQNSPGHTSAALGFRCVKPVTP